ncbi:hypothetical protein JTB14_029464 [Gonioctena quinquepunctata]|nr:hypothetical protein JTB14_029464 [Gonioctena quinquepunctata]
MAFLENTINVRGLCSKTTGFKLNIHNCDHDLIFLAELFFGDEFAVFRRDRKSTKSTKSAKSEGGGVLIATRREIQVVERPEWQSDAEDLWLTLYTPKKGKIHLCCVFLPPGDDEAVAYFTNNLLRLFNIISDDAIFICGDLDMSNTSWNFKQNCSILIPSFVDTKFTNLKDILNFYGLVQFNSLKNNNDKILDLVLRNELDVKNLNSGEPSVREDSHHRYRY